MDSEWDAGEVNAYLALHLHLFSLQSHFFSCQNFDTFLKPVSDVLRFLQPQRLICYQQPENMQMGEQRYMRAVLSSILGIDRLVTSVETSIEAECFTSQTLARNALATHLARC